ncbi:MAG: DEAD/DEAH box helicase [Deltaproteobacteria bacterium]|nr:DEAD/DEAH box helicase [Deltaproteobacteria bacterium]
MEDNGNQTNDLTGDDAAENSQAIEDTAPPVSFRSLGLSGALIEAIEAMGFEHPTDVQREVIPEALNRSDLLVQSHTGSGKTAAFAIPLLQDLVSAEVEDVQALVLCPTRELAIQVAAETSRLAAGQPIVATAIYGGAAMGPQIQALKGKTQIVVGTPGRVLDHMRRGTLKTSNIGVFILDECDEMLSMGFLEDISAISARLPDEHQTMLFSATIPDEIQRMADRTLEDPVEISLSSDSVGAQSIHHAYYLVSGGAREQDLLRVLEYENPRLALCFCNTRNDTAHVARFLAASGYAAEGISSDLSQQERERVMQRMRDGELRILVATDIAARGIDLSKLTHVINYGFPESADAYIHRTGRTGRAGRSGVAISLVSPREIGSFYYLKLLHRIEPEERHLPTAAELAARREGEICQNLRERYIDRTTPQFWNSLVQRLWSMPDGPALIGAALREHLESDSEQEKPLRRRRRRQAGSAESSSDELSTEEQPSRHRSEPAPRRGRERGSDSRRPRRQRRRGEENDSPRAAPRDGASRGRAESFTTANGEVEFYETLPATSVADLPADDNEAVSADSVRLYIGVGRRHGVRASELKEWVQAQGEVESGAIEQFSLRDRHTFVSVSSGLAEAIIERLNGKTFNERPVRVERARGGTSAP